MKTRTIIFIAISAMGTLSFTFASIKKEVKPKVEIIQNKSTSEPVGGFLSEDKF
jgi:hypothetical protein